MRRLLVVVAVALLCCGTAEARPTSVGHQSAVAGRWRAVLTFQHNDGFPAYSHLRLAVWDGGRLVLAQPVALHEAHADYVEPGGTGNSALSFRDLDANGSPELLLALYTGGAHCCSVEQVFDFSGGVPRSVEKNFGDPGMRVQSIHGHVVLRSADDAFAYAFTSYAGSGLPLQIWQYRHQQLTDVTLDFPRLIGADARAWWRSYLQEKRQHADVRGLLAPWAADQALLGRERHAHETLLRIASRGGITAAGLGGPQGSAYVRALWRFLRRNGYLR